MNSEKAEEKLKFKAGRRYVVKTYPVTWNSGLVEIKILAISAGGLIKVKYCFEDGGTMWQRPDDFEIVEDLDALNCKI